MLLCIGFGDDAEKGGHANWLVQFRSPRRHVCYQTMRATRTQYKNHTSGTVPIAGMIDGSTTGGGRHRLPKRSQGKHPADAAR
jgi:hypothetical protein